MIRILFLILLQLGCYTPDTLFIKFEQAEVEEAYCDACGKAMFDKELNTIVVGMSVSMMATEEEREFYQEQLGDYELGRIYRICWECLYKSLGIKP